MNKHKLTSICITVMMTACVFAASLPPVPRKSPEFIISEPSGKTLLLSSFRGKVVVLEFFFLQSPHCMRVAQTLNQLGSEMGSQGVQPLGVVFDPPKVRTPASNLIPLIAGNSKLTFPIGYASKEEVDRYLGRAGGDILAIPQVLVIDRAGVIRAATGNQPNPTLETEDSLRTFLNELLKEDPSSGASAKPPSPDGGRTQR